MASSSSSDATLTRVDERIYIPCITLQQVGIVDEDDWTGLSSAAHRRKVQNRLNQRAHRKRKANEAHPDRVSPSTLVDRAAETKNCCAGNNAAGVGDISVTNLEVESRDPELWRLFHSAAGDSKLDRSELGRAAAVCKLGSTDARKTISEFETWVNCNRMTSPTADHVLALVKFNVFRALINNSTTLGFSTEEGMEDDAVSPFATSPNTHIHALPKALRPTKLQRQVLHHPWIDLLPIPEMRDNLIRAGDTFDDMELCGDLVGFFSASTGRTGMIIWGEPWDITGWEVTESFLRSWGWTIKGCSKIIESTNYWRARRGEKPLNFDRVLFEEIA